MYCGIFIFLQTPVLEAIYCLCSRLNIWGRTSRSSVLKLIPSLFHKYLLDVSLT